MIMKHFINVNVLHNRDFSRTAGSTTTEDLPAPATREPSIRRSTQQQEQDDDDEDETDSGFDSQYLEKVKTELYAPNTGPHFTYNRVPWTLSIRKEVR